MNRKILFRGQRLNNSEWIEGNLLLSDDGKVARIIIWNNIGYDEYPVDPATIGQYTGVVDKNGKQVYEGDIIGYTDTGETSVFGVVKWYHEGNFYINSDSYCNYTSDNDCANVGYMLNRATTKLQVMGNIYDNPSMLKGGTQ